MFTDTAFKLFTREVAESRNSLVDSVGTNWFSVCAIDGIGTRVNINSAYITF